MVEVLDQYSGRQKGTYELGVKENGTADLTLSFKKKKLPPITVSLMMEDNKLYMNEERVMAVLNTECE